MSVHEIFGWVGSMYYAVALAEICALMTALLSVVVVAISIIITSSSYSQLCVCVFRW